MKTKILVSVVAVFFIIVGNAFAVSFNYTGPSAVDVDNSYPSTNVFLNVVDTGIITDMNLNLVISEPYVDDFFVQLIHNDIIVRVYSGGQADTAASYINATFDDQASNSYPVNGTVEGVFKPFEFLSAFNGAELSGLWRLRITDRYVPGDGNDLIAWSISGTTETVPEPSTMLLLGLGLLGVATVRRKIKK